MTLRSEPTPEELAAVDRDQRLRKLERFKKTLWRKKQAGDVAGQSASQFASKVLGKVVSDLEALTEEELAALVLNGGKNG